MDTNSNQSNNKDYHLENLIKKLNTFLSNEKPADVLIIKAHLLCEYYLNHLLILKDVCTAGQVETLPFSVKKEKAKDLYDAQDKQKKQLFDLLGRLNKLRNKVGHELAYSLSESDVDSLGYLEGKQYILDKYNVETDTERLRDLLIKLVIQTAMLLITAIREEKKKDKSQN